MTFRDVEKAFLAYYKVSEDNTEDYKYFLLVIKMMIVAHCPFIPCINFSGSIK